MGHAYSIPVMVVCETFKFCDRVQLDAFVFNELANPYDLLAPPHHQASPQSAPPKAADKKQAKSQNLSIQILQAGIAEDRPLRVPLPSLLSETDYNRLQEHLSLLNVMYDVTPAEYITVVICEVGWIPVTSIPVVLREYNVASNI